MNEQDKVDEAIEAQALSAHVLKVIRKTHADGEIDIKTYNRLYEAARAVDGQVRKLVDSLQKGQS